MICQNHELFLMRNGVTTNDMAPRCHRRGTHETIINENLDDERTIVLCPRHVRGLATLMGCRLHRIGAVS